MTVFLSCVAMLVWWLGIRADVKRGVFTTRLLFVSYCMLPFAIYPLYAAMYGSDIIGWRDLDSAKTASIQQGATLLAIGFTVLFLVGNVLVSSIQPRSLPSLLTPPSPKQFRAAIWTTWLIGVGAAALLSIFVYSIFGSIAEYLLLQGAYRGGEYQGTGYLTLPASLLFPFSVFLVLVAYMANGAKRIWFFVAVVVVSNYASLFLGFRGSTAFFLLALVLVTSSIGLLQMREGIAVIVLGVFLFSAYNIVREAADPGANDGSAKQTVRRVLNPVLRTAANDVVSLVLEQEGEYKHEYFALLPEEWLQSLIPANLLGNERTSFSERFGYQIMGQALQERDPLTQLTSYRGSSPTVVGFLAWQAGIAGVLLVAPLLGALCSYIDRKLRHTTEWRSKALWAVMGAVFVYAFESPADAVNFGLKVVGAYWILLLSFGVMRAMLHVVSASTRFSPGVR